MKKPALLLLLLVFICCKEESPVSLKEDVTFLASDALKGRETGTKGELLAADYIRKRFKHIGLTPKGNAGTYYQTFTFTPRTDPHSEVEFNKNNKDTSATITGTNVIGFLDHKSTNTVIIGAHYDHLGMGGEGSLYREGEAIHNGADDNASGVAILLKLASELQTEEYKGNNYLFIAFSGEEMGLLGSNYFTKNPTIDFAKANYMINMDMVGRLNEEKAIAVHGVGTSPIWPQTIFAANEDFKLSEHESGVGPSDHTSFYLNDVPVLHFFTGQHSDYHKPGDDTEKLNYEGMESIASYIKRIIKEVKHILL